MGSMLQDIVVQAFADMKKAIGHWRCRACNHLHEFQLRPWACAACGVEGWPSRRRRSGSRAPSAARRAASISCSRLGEPKLRAIEIKTIDKDMFKDKHTKKELVAPLAEHKLRTAFYLRIIAESDHPWASMVSTDAATILYVSKGGYGCQDPTLKTWGLKEQFTPFKEFTIKRDDKMVESLQPARQGHQGFPRRQGRHALRRLSDRVRQARQVVRAALSLFLGRVSRPVRMEGMSHADLVGHRPLDQGHRPGAARRSRASAQPKVLIEAEVEFPQEGLGAEERHCPLRHGESCMSRMPDKIVLEGYSLNLQHASSVVPLVELGGLLRFMLFIRRLQVVRPARHPR